MKILKCLFLSLVFGLAACSDEGDEKPKERVCGFIYSCSSSTIKVYAGPDQTVYSGSFVQLQGGSDAWNSAGITYEWMQRSGPAVSLNNPNQPFTSFTAPTVSSITELQFRLTLRKKGKKTSDSVGIWVQPVSATPEAVNQEVEPNDSQSLANVLPFTAETTDVFASVDSTLGDSVDFFAFMPPATADYRVVVCNSVSDCDHGAESPELYMTVYDQDLSMLSGTSPGVPSRQELTLALSAGVPYYIGVTDWNGSGNYRLMITRN